MNNTEQELKLALTESEYAALLSVCGAAPQLQTNYYFVYDNMSADEMLRVRAKNAAYLLCYKRKIAVDSDVYVSDERETAIDRATAMEMLRGGMQAPLVKQLVGANIPQTAHCIGKTDTYRAAFDLREWHLELDKNVYCGVVDYELECENRDVSQLAALRLRALPSICTTVFPYPFAIPRPSSVVFWRQDPTNLPNATSI